MLLVTGGAGFIGSHFLRYMLDHFHNEKIVNLDKVTYAADLTTIESLSTYDNYTFVKGDICDQSLIQELFNRHAFTGVIHFAAESHVDNSIHGPEVFIDTNIKGTFNLLHAAKTCWMEAPFKVKSGFESARFHHVSTDEVYGSLGKEGVFLETTPYAPNSPYSASKASSDFLVRSYHHTFGLNMTISNCSNNFGPHQHGEKLIPTIIRNALTHQPIPIYGKGENVRDWLYVTDHCSAIADIFYKGRSGETYNVGTRNEKNNLELCHDICRLLDEEHPSDTLTHYNELITFVSDRPGHDLRYAIDPTKLEQELDWKASGDFDSDLRHTVRYYINQYSCIPHNNI